MSITSLSFLSRVILLPVKCVCSRNIIQTKNFHLTRYLSSSSDGLDKKIIRPFSKFLCQVLPEIMIKYPTIAFPDKYRLIGKLWHAMDISEKKKRLDDFYEEYENYFIARLLQEAKTGQKIQRIKNPDDKKKKEKKKFKQKQLMLGKPKKPLPMFFMYMEDKRHTFPKGKPVKYHVVKLAEDFRNMPEEEKMKYRIEREKLLDVYKVELNEWEAKLIAQGVTDVVPENKKFKNIPLKKR